MENRIIALTIGCIIGFMFDKQILQFIQFLVLNNCKNNDYHVRKKQKTKSS